MPTLAFGALVNVRSGELLKLKSDDVFVRTLKRHSLVLGVVPPRGCKQQYMCCILPGFSSRMLATDDIADAKAVISQTSNISKGSAAATGVSGARSPNPMVRDEAPPSPITPSPRQTNGTWQRPSQNATDNIGHASTSDRDEERSRLRWAINIKKWTPWDDEWLFLLDMLPEEDQKEVPRFSNNYSNNYPVP